MQPDYYCNLELRSYAGASVPVIASKVMEALHPVFAEHTATYALALPYWKSGAAPTPGHTLRLFAAERDALNWIMDQLEQQVPLCNYLVTGRIRRAPQDWEGDWTTFQRFRIPARQGKSEAHQAKRLKLRAKRLAEAQRLPYFRLRSRSTQQSFALTVQKNLHSGIETAGGQPDSYGLSRSESPVFLPELP